MVSGGGIESSALGEILPLVGLYTFAAYRLQPSLHYIFSGVSSLRFGKTAIDDIYEDLYELRSSSELKDQNFNSLGLKIN